MTTTTPPQSPHGGRSVVIIASIGAAAVAVVIAVVLTLGFATPGFFRTPKLKIDDVEHGVQKILTDDTVGYGAKNVGNVNCNNGQDPTVTKGGTFDCQLTINGVNRRVRVTMLDTNGTFEVGRPK